MILSLVVDKMASRMNIPAMREPRMRTRRNRRLIVLLILFFITILLLLFFHSSYSRITSIQVAGNVYVSEAEILEASGIRPDDYFFTASSETIRKRVAAIEIVEDAFVKKKFPGQVFIEVKEYPEVAYQVTPEGKLEVILANGSAIPIEDKPVVIDKPILTGWTDQEMKSRLTATLAQISPEFLTDISEIKPDPSKAYPDKIVMYTRSFFQIETTIGKLPEKIKGYRLIIKNQMDQGVRGGIIMMLEVDRFRPYPDDVQADEDEEEAGDAR